MKNDIRVEDILTNGFYSNSHYYSTVNSDDTTKVLGIDGDDHLTPVNGQLAYTSGMREVALLVKYYTDKGLKPRHIKAEIIKLWKNYDPLVDYKKLNHMISNVRAKVKKNPDYMVTREKSNVVTVTDGEIEWFLDPEKNFNVTELRYLFTLYCYCKNENRPYVHMNHRKEEFRKSSGLKSNYTSICSSLRVRGFTEYGPDQKTWEFIKNPRGDFEEQRRVYNRAMGLLTHRCLFMDEVKELESGKEHEIKIDGIGNYITGVRKEEGIKHKNKEIEAGCPECGQIFVKKSRRQDELCPECRKIRRKEYMKKYKQEQRSKETEEEIKETED